MAYRGTNSCKLYKCLLRIMNFTGNKRALLAGLFILFSGLIASYLAFTLKRYPLFEFSVRRLQFYFSILIGVSYQKSLYMQVNDIDWTRNWLYMTILDYYGSTFALSAIVLTSEPWPYGIIWSAAFCLLGSPFCCAYIAYRVIFKTIELKNNQTQPKIQDNE